MTGTTSPILVAANPTGGRLLGHLYVQDLRSGRRTLVDRADGLDGAEANGYARQFGVSMSADGRYVAFTSRATNLDPDDRDRSGRCLRSRPRHRYDHVGEPCGAAATARRGTARSGRGGSLSADGRYVAFTLRRGEPGSRRQPLRQRHRSTPSCATSAQSRTTLAGRSQSGARGNARALSSPPCRAAAATWCSALPHTTSTKRTRTTGPTSTCGTCGRHCQCPAVFRTRRIRSVRRSGQGGLSVTGRASDDGELQVVEVSLTRRLPGGRCERWNALWIRTPSRRGRCRPRFDLAAHFTKHWWRRFDAGDPPGYLRASAHEPPTRPGQRERVFSTGRGNRRVFRIR